MYSKTSKVDAMDEIVYKKEKIISFLIILLTIWKLTDNLLTRAKERGGKNGI